MRLLRHLGRIAGLAMVMVALTGWTNAQEQDRLEEYFSGAASSAAATHLILFTTLPAEDGTGGVEVANANGYARLAFARNGTNWGSSTAGAPSTIQNLVEAAFASASGGSWGTVVGWGYATSGTYGAGTVEWGGALTASKTVDDGDTFRFAAGALVSKLGDPGDTYT